MRFPERRKLFSDRHVMFKSPSLMDSPLHSPEWINGCESIATPDAHIKSLKCGFSMVCQLVYVDLHRRLGCPMSQCRASPDFGNGSPRYTSLRFTIPFIPPPLQPYMHTHKNIDSPRRSFPVRSRPPPLLPSLTGGHYTADAVQHDGQWLRFNDAVVDAVPLELVLAERPYLLFYQRIR